MPLYSATVIWNGIDFVVSHKKRDDGKGSTSYGIEAADFEEAEKEARELYAKADYHGPDGLPKSLLLIQKEPHVFRAVEWTQE